MDPDVIRAIYNEIQRLTAAGKRTKEARAEYEASIPVFESFATCEVTPFPMTVQKGHWNVQQTTAFHLCLKREGYKYRYSWSCRLYADMTIFTSSVLPIMYNMQPIVNPARVKWRAVAKLVAVRPYAWHWLEQHEILTCAPGGAGRKRDRAAYEADALWG
jgi:hypothetical protein